MLMCTGVVCFSSSSSPNKKATIPKQTLFHSVYYQLLVMLFIEFGQNLKKKKKNLNLNCIFEILYFSKFLFSFLFKSRDTEIGEKYLRNDSLSPFRLIDSRDHCGLCLLQTRNTHRDMELSNCLLCTTTYQGQQLIGYVNDVNDDSKGNSQNIPYI